MEDGALLPDLAAGFMEMGQAGRNQWLTPIQAALHVRDGKASVWSFLAHPCRSEIVPEPGGEAGIFDAVGPYEVLAGVVNGECCMIRHGMRDFLPVDGAISDFGESVRVACRERPVRSLDPFRTAADIRAGRLRMTDLFCRFDYEIGRFRCAIVAPCRYLNFLATDDGASPYAQPICGPVLSFDDKGFALAWVAGQARPGTAPEIRVELARSMVVDARVLLRRAGSEERGLPEDADIEPLLIDQFCFNRAYAGALGLFVYA